MSKKIWLIKGQSDIEGTLYKDKRLIDKIIINLDDTGLYFSIKSSHIHQA